MPDLPQTASFHVIAAAAQRAGESVRLMLRTKETDAFALIISPMLAADIGLRIPATILPSKEAPIRLRRFNKGRRDDPAKQAIFLEIDAAVRAAGPNASASAIMRRLAPGMIPQSYYNWRIRQQERALEGRLSNPHPNHEHHG